MFDLITRHGLALIFANVLLEQLGVPLPANQMQPQVALEDAARLTNLAAVHAHEVGCLGIEGAGVDLLRCKRAIEQRRELVEIGFHVRGFFFLPVKR